MSFPVPIERDPRRASSPEIAAALRRAIQQGELRPGERLPAIQELARRFGTTAITVRRALRDLEEAGLVHVEHGVGSFVADWIGAFDRLPGFAEEMAQRQRPIETRLLGREPAGVDPRAAGALGQVPGTPLAVLRRLRLIGGTPVAVQHSWLHPDLAAVAAAYAETESLYAMLARLTGRVPVALEETLRAVSLPEAMARLLQATPGAPGWRSERLTRDAAGAPLVYDEAYLSGERMALRLRRRGALVEAGFTFEATGSAADPEGGSRARS